MNSNRREKIQRIRSNLGSDAQSSDMGFDIIQNLRKFANNSTKLLAEELYSGNVRYYFV